MKKLEKLTLKEMGNEMAVISPSKLPELIGGSGSDDIPPSFNSAQDVWDYAWEEMADEFFPITDIINNAYETMEDAKNNFVNWVETNHVLETAGSFVVGVGVLAVDIIATFMGIPSTLGMPIYTPSDVDSSSGSTYSS